MTDDRRGDRGAQQVPGHTLGRRERGVLCLATALAALLTGIGIGRQPLWHDEAFSVALVSQGWGAMWRHMAASEANMCAYHVLLKLWIRLGDSEAFLRSLSALFAVGTIPVQHLLARRLGGPRVAAVAALLLSGHVYLVRYGQEARAYIMVCFLSALSSLLLLRALAAPGFRRWLAYVLSGALLLHFHILGALVLLGHGAGVLLLRPASSWPRAALALLGVGALSLPLLSFFVSHRRVGNISWVPPISVRQVLQVAADLGGMGAMPALYLAGVVAAAHAWRRQRIPRGAATAALWFAVPCATLLALSLLLRPMFQAAYLIGVLPGLTILAAFGLAQLARPFSLAAAVFALAASAGSLGWWHLSDHKEDWRSAVAYVAARAQPGDGMLVLPPYLRPGIDYYLLRAGDAARRIAPAFPAVPWGQMGRWDLFVGEVIRGEPRLERIAESRRLWVLTPSGVHVPDPRSAALLEGLAARGYAAQLRQVFEVDVRLLSR